MKKKFRISRVTAILCLFCVLGLWADVWYNNYEKALKAIEKNDFSAAIQYLSAAIKDKNRPKLNAKTIGMRFLDYLPYYYLGVAYYRSGQYDEAAKYFEQSLNHGVVQQKPELSEQLQRMLNDCVVKLAPRLKDTPRPVSSTATEVRDTKPQDSTTPQPITKPPTTVPENAEKPVVQSPNPVSSAPTGPIIPGANMVDPLLVEGAKLFRIGDLAGARAKFEAILQIDARHAGAAKWLKKISLAMGIRDLNQCIRSYFASDRANCERSLRQVIDVLKENDADKKSLITAYQFLAVVLIERHLLEDDPGNKRVTEAKFYIALIKKWEPQFQLEAIYFSPKVVKIFSEQ